MASLIPSPDKGSQTGSHVARQLWQFPGKLAIENIAVRPDGTLLLTSFHSGDLFTLDPSLPSPTLSTVITLHPCTGLAGISALDPTGSLFAISGGEHVPFGFVKGTVAVYVVRLPADTDGTGGDGGEPAAATILDRILVDGLLNGMTSLPGSLHIALSVDSTGGKVMRIDTRTRMVDVAITDEAMRPTADFPLGVNGVRAPGDGFLYFTNSAQGLYARLAIDELGNRKGEVEVLATLPTLPANRYNAYDDFVFDGEGNAYVALHDDKYMKITPEKKQTVFVARTEDGGKLYEPTSAGISRDGKTLYLVTGGSVSDGKVVGGQVLEVKI